MAKQSKPDEAEVPALPGEAEAPALPTRFRNVSPLGALDVPAVGRIIEHGEVFEVRDAVAELIAPQAEHFEPTDEPVGLPGDDIEGDTE